MDFVIISLLVFGVLAIMSEIRSVRSVLERANGNYCECPGNTRISKTDPDICPVCEKPYR